MKTLHFAALENERVAPALAGQAADSLRPFIDYLQAAIDSAEQRQIRTWVRWEPAPQPHRIRVRPLDSVLELEPGPPRFHVRDWPVGVVPDTAQPLMIVNRSTTAAVQRVELTAEGPIIELREGGVEATDKVFWCGHPCQCLPLAQDADAHGVFNASGMPLPTTRRLSDDGRTWLLIELENVSEIFDSAGRRITARRCEPFDGLDSLRGADGSTLHWSGREEFEVVELPPAGVLRGDNGVRFSWEEVRSRSRRPQKGFWVQLLPPERLDADAAVDPRTGFCDDSVKEVRTQPRAEKAHAFEVRDCDRQNYQLLLDRAPPPGSQLYLPLDTRALRRQRAAMLQLRDAPSPHHRGLLKLLEHPDKVTWPRVQPSRVDSWFVLRDESTSGTQAQREFVARALATPELAFLEGPPGSGKTHAICELVLQLLARGQRVLLCSTTNVAVDNVLERLGRKDFERVDAVRIGRPDRVDSQVRDFQLDVRVENLVAHWRNAPLFARHSDKELEKMAREVVLASANLTCGTTTGILGHPFLRSAEGERWPVHAPKFDTLILDETSKTTFQEFLVPALLARRWVLVGDVRQLPPFTEREDLESGLRHLSNERGARLPESHQRSCLLIHRLTRPQAVDSQVRWLVAETKEVLDSFQREWHRRATTEGARLPEVLRLVGRRTGGAPSAFYRELSLQELEQGAPEALRLMTSRLVLVERTLLPRVATRLPADLCLPQPAHGNEMETFLARQAHWSQKAGSLPRRIMERGVTFTTAHELASAEARFLGQKDWAGEVGWRLVRIHELDSAKGGRERRNREQELETLLPHAEPESGWVGMSVGAVQDVGLRSVLELLQHGSRRAGHTRRPSALTQGIPRATWTERFVRLEYQHRMHPQISAFPRSCFYEDGALRDASTLDGREAQVGWSFEPTLPSRRAWLEVSGTEREGVNTEEVETLREALEQFLAWARLNPRLGGRWQVACLTFYVRQEGELRRMLRKVTGQSRGETRFETEGVELVCGTVDRFQGREADVVMLSMRNTRRVGFLDSPHRLNVAVTRARHLLLIIGRREYFRGCGVAELESLAEQTPPWKPLRRRGS
jgi:hypothetical protein